MMFGEIMLRRLGEACKRWWCGVIDEYVVQYERYGITEMMSMRGRALFIAAIYLCDLPYPLARPCDVCAKAPAFALFDVHVSP